MPQTNPENREAGLHQITYRLHGITQRHRIARTIREKKCQPAYRKASAAGVVAGTTCTRKPLWRSRRKILYFMPKS